MSAAREILDRLAGAAQDVRDAEGALAAARERRGHLALEARQAGVSLAKVAETVETDQAAIALILDNAAKRRIRRRSL